MSENWLTLEDVAADGRAYRDTARFDRDRLYWATEIIQALRAGFSALRGPASEGICFATTNRQLALEAIAAQSDLVLVVGSANSSNSLRLVELARRRNTPSYLIDGPGDILPEWLNGVGVLGLTADASAPPPEVLQS